MKMMSDERGYVTVFMAVFMGLVMLGFLAFALDVGYLFHEKRTAQAAADAAALAAAEEASAGNTGNEQNAANAVATLNGFNTSATTNPAVVSLTTSSSGLYSNASGAAQPGLWVTAVVSQPIHTFFLGAFNNNMRNMAVSAWAVAGGPAASSTCVCLGKATGTCLNMSNDSNLTTGSNCQITCDSNASNAITVVGSASVCSGSIGTVSTTWNYSTAPYGNGPNINNGGSLCSTAKVDEGVSACSSPVPNVPVDTTCTSASGPSSWTSSYTTGPGSTYGTTISSANGNTVCYNGLTVNGNGQVTILNTGIYVINGGTLHFESGTNGGGNGVVFYLTNGANLLIDNGANVNLVAGGNKMSGGGTAPSTGIYNGIVIYQDPGYPAAANDPTTDTGDAQAISIQGGASTYFNGEILAPLAAITLGNGSGSKVNGGIVALSLTMNGGGTLNATPNINMGSGGSAGPAKLVQ